MIRYAEIADYHFSPQWIEHSIACSQAVANEELDFIALTGDFFDSPIYATRSGGIEQAIEIVRKWANKCPVVTVEGTPSHDAPGCYSALEDYVTVLKPGKVYGLIDGQIVENPKDCQCVLFGVPELSKKNIQAQLGLTADEANAEAVNRFTWYCENFIAPMRLKYAGVPAYGILHGNVSDSTRDNEIDIILKASDIVIHTEDLAIANLDRWSLGHIHTPWESKIINAGYSGFTGMDKNPWGKTGFTPAFNVIEDGKLIKRVPYGAPKRIKVKHSSEITNELNCCWWVHTSDEMDVLPEGLHSWSRITYKESSNDTRRVTEEESEQAKTLWDYFKLIDPSVDSRIESKVSLITETIEHVDPIAKDVRTTDIEVAGCILFKGRTVKLSNLQEGLNQLIGENGDGKSSLLAMCHPYPVIIGKNKGDIVKNFFNSQDSYIKKTVYLNGEKHSHLITVRGAHTKSPKTECYLTIGSTPILGKGTLKEMMEKCQELYGEFDDYRITSFCEQPLQAYDNKSGLMSAKAIEARDIVLKIAGIDREQEKRFALDKVSELEKQQVKLEVKLETLKAGLYHGELSTAETEKRLAIAQNDLELITSEGKVLTGDIEQLEAYQQLYRDNEKVKAELESNKKLIAQLEAEIGNICAYREQITHDDKLIAYLDYVDKKSRNDKNIRDKKEAEELKASLPGLQQELINLEHNKDQKRKQAELDNLEAKKQAINQPCEHCGKLPSSLQAKMDLIDNEINSITIEPLKPVQDESTLYTRLARAEQAHPELITIESLDHVEPVEGFKLSSFERQSIIQSIKEAEQSETKIALLKDDKRVAKDMIDKADELQALKIKQQLLRDRWTSCKVDIAKCEAEIKAINERITEQAVKLKEIAEVEAQLDSKDIEDWKYIASMLASNKIPALELDVFLGVIDSEATNNIEPFLEGQYAFRTTTQENGVDKFDIFIHDRATGKELSLFDYNPGHKAFFSDAYIKALIKQRNSRMHRTYSPIIFDEADSPIKEHRIPMYYEMNRRYFSKDKATVLIVSQKDSAVNYMNNVIDVREL